MNQAVNPKLSIYWLYIIYDCQPWPDKVKKGNQTRGEMQLTADITAVAIARNDALAISVRKASQAELLQEKYYYS